MSRWVVFKELRERLDFAVVLADYGVEVNARGDQAAAFCPLPGHKERSKRKSRSFSVNLAKGIFQCFGCQAKGNVLDFAAMMEGLDPNDGEQLRRAGMMLQGRYLGDSTSEKPPAVVREAPAVKLAEPEGERVVNAPLGFALKSIDGRHEYLAQRGMTADTIAHFGVGYCDKGLMKGRIVIPLHSAAGELIGYAGRIVDDKEVNDENPKYRLPGSRKVGDAVHEFRKSEFLFNGHRIAGPVMQLLVVEGFFGAMWLHQCGYQNVIALMGASCGPRQAQLIVELTAADGLVWVMPDGDAGGRLCALSVFENVAGARPVRWVRLEEGKQPDSFTAPELAALLDREAAEEHGT